MSHPFILTLSCAERPGIVHAVTAFLFENGCDIVEHQQFDDALRGQLFLRTAFVCAADTDAERLVGRLRGGRRRVRHDLPDHRRPAAAGAGDGVQARPLPQRPDLPVACRQPRRRARRRGVQPRGPAADGRGRRPAVPPRAGDRRPPRSRPRPGCSSWSTSTGPTWWCWRATCRCSRTRRATALYGRAINIHHSFLPGFKGAKPYHQAFDRGVKLVGATAHYVTP